MTVRVPHVRIISPEDAEALYLQLSDRDQIPSLRPAFLSAWGRSTGREVIHVSSEGESGTLVDAIIEEEVPGTGLVDWQSPPPYGGLFCLGDPDSLAWRSLLAFSRDRGAIADFHRFHPLSPLPDSLQLDCAVNRTTRYVDLKQALGPRFEMKPGAYRNSRSAAQRGLRMLECELHESNFPNRYSRAMERLGAREDLRFAPAYFDAIGVLETTRTFEVWHREAVIASAVVLCGPTLAEYHLGEFSREGAPLRAANYLFSTICELLKAEGLETFFLGGGRSTDADDSLLRFKGTIAANQADFRTLGSVLSSDFHELPSRNSERFLHYRDFDSRET